MRGMRDEVDELVEAWARERGDLDLAPVEVFSRVTRLARHVDRVRRAAFSAHGIETWEFDVLAALRRAGAPYELSPGRLLAETMVTSGTMTNRVDRLTARGLRGAVPRPRRPPRRAGPADARGPAGRRRGLRGAARRRARADRRPPGPGPPSSSPRCSGRCWRRSHEAAADALALLALVFASGAGPAAASCAADSGPAGADGDLHRHGGGGASGLHPVRGGRGLGGTRPGAGGLGPVRAAPAAVAAVRAVGGRQLGWTPSSSLGCRYAVGATSDFATGACSVAEASSVPNLRPADVRTPVAGGSHGSDAPAGPWLTGLGFVALVGIPVGVGAALLARRRRRVRDV